MNESDETQDDESSQADQPEDVAETQEEKARQLRKTASGLHCMAYEARDEVGDQDLFEQLMTMGDNLERRAAEAIGQRPYNVVLEFGPVYALSPDEAVDECLCGAVTPNNQRTEEITRDA